MKAGDSFIVPARGEVPEHLFVVVSDPSQNSEDVLVANVTSWTGNRSDDSGCKLTSGDHPFVRHDSYICYARAKTVQLEYLEEKISSGVFRPQDRMSGAVLARIQQGVLNSVHAIYEHQSLMRKQGLAALPTAAPARSIIRRNA